MMRLSEIVLPVADMQGQVEFYRDMLGLEVLHPLGIADFSAVHRVEFDTGDCVLSLEGGGTMGSGGKMPRIVFQMEYIEAAHDALSDMGVDLGELRNPSPGVTVCDGRDPEGNAFSFERKS